jgi:hypothetical protein
MPGYGPLLTVASAETPRPLGTRRPPEAKACALTMFVLQCALGPMALCCHCFKRIFVFSILKITGRIDPALAGLDLRSKFDRRQAPTGARQDIQLT